MKIEFKEYDYSFGPRADYYPSGHFYCGDTMIGTGYGQCNIGRGRAEAVGDDLEIQTLLDEWLVDRRSAAERLRETRAAAQRAAERAKTEMARKAARRALGLPERAK
jgi:hypothetical protein